MVDKDKTVPLSSSHVIRFTVYKEISDPIKVWEVVREVKNIPLYWRGIRELNVEEVSPGMYEGRVRFAFPSSSRVRLEVSDQERRLTFLFSGGILRGFNQVKVSDRTLESSWEVEMPFYMRPFQSRNQEHFRKGTENALERIVIEAARRVHG